MATRTHKKTTSVSHAPSLAGSAHSRSTSSSHSRKGHSVARASHKLHGQQAIEPERVTQIQEALIREHYMTGDANGEWDSTTQAAMQKFQADHGWQTKLMPDSRALKTLGLGPDYSGAINAKTASFGAPPPISTIPAPQAAGFAAASHTDH
jgi:peptidoglycan hydrolase-like protein with peptidoglycan-binding domain